MADSSKKNIVTNETTTKDLTITINEKGTQTHGSWYSVAKKDCKNINEHIIKSNNCRLVLYLKYENLSCKISAIQVIVIIASTLITFFETLKTQMKFSNNELRVMSISLSTFIAMSLSIARYLKMDETKEDIYKLLQNFSIAEKELKTLKDKYKACMQDNDKDHYLHESVYRDQQNKILQEKSRIFNGFTESVTQYNTILSYNENIFYRRQILNMSFEDKINDIYEKKLQDLHTISVEQLNRYQRNELIDNALRKFFGPACCFVHRYKYNDFFKDYDIKKNKLVNQRKPTLLNKCLSLLYYNCDSCLDAHSSNDSKNGSLEHNDDEDDNDTSDEEKGYTNGNEHNIQIEVSSPHSKETRDSGFDDFSDDKTNKATVGCLWP